MNQPPMNRIFRIIAIIALLAIGSMILGAFLTAMLVHKTATSAEKYSQAEQVRQMSNNTMPSPMQPIGNFDLWNSLSRM